MLCVCVSDRNEMLAANFLFDGGDDMDDDGGHDDQQQHQDLNSRYHRFPFPMIKLMGPKSNWQKPNGGRRAGCHV